MADAYTGQQSRRPLREGTREKPKQRTVYPLSGGR